MERDRSTMDDQSWREAFVLFDVNRDGRITARELEAMFEFLRIPTSRAEVVKMIQDADCDGNGTVELEEFLRMMRRYTQCQKAKSPDDELREAFNVFDHNQDSYIDFAEIKLTMNSLGQAVTDEEVKEMIRAADRDNDGLVDFDEFKQMMQLLTGSQKPENSQNSHP